MKVTPVDIQHKQFRKALQGYAREEVDSFLDDIIETLEEMIDERGKLEARISELNEKLAYFKAMEDSLQSTLVLAQRTAVMKDGRIVELGLTDQILEDPQHPYTQLLVSAQL